MLRLTAFLTLALLMTGCSAAAAYRVAAAETGADAADQTLASAEWVLCNAAPVGAVKRRYNTDDKRDAYNTLCPEAVLP